MTEKKVDESWKESIRKEKTPADLPRARDEEVPQKEEAPQTAPEADFSYFISTLGMQALAALGVLPDPATGKPKPTISSEDLAQAKYLIDIIQMIFQKTKGNLTAEESASLEELMYQLRVRFVEKNGLN